LGDKWFSNSTLSIPQEPIGDVGVHLAAISGPDDDIAVYWFSENWKFAF
jgi:hypothetical protein